MTPEELAAREVAFRLRVGAGKVPTRFEQVISALLPADNMDIAKYIFAHLDFVYDVPNNGKCDLGDVFDQVKDLRPMLEADARLAALGGGGGALIPQQAQQFFNILVDQSKFLDLVTEHALPEYEVTRVHDETVLVKKDPKE